MALLEVRDLKVRFPIKGGVFAPEKFVRAVDGVSFDIAPGEIVGLVGESGCGKSTLGRAIVRLENPSTGTIELNGANLSAMSGAKLRSFRKNVQMIFQDPYGSLNPRLCIFETLDEVLKLHTALDDHWRAKRVVALLEQVGIDPAYQDRYPHQFSGGQRQRIGIARALAVSPKLIVADEPVSALDVSVQAQIINLLSQIRNNTQTAFLFIAHDLAVVEHISDRIMVMYLGRIVESGLARDICRNPKHPYTQALLSAVPTIDSVTRRKRIILAGDVPSPVDPPSGCPFHPRCAKAQECCSVDKPEIVECGDGHFCSCFFASRD